MSRVWPFHAPCSAFRAKKRTPQAMQLAGDKRFESFCEATGLRNDQFTEGSCSVSIRRRRQSPSGGPVRYIPPASSWRWHRSPVPWFWRLPVAARIAPASSLKINQPDRFVFVHRHDYVLLTMVRCGRKLGTAGQRISDLSRSAAMRSFSCCADDQHEK